MTELTFVDINNYDINKFDIDPKAIDTYSFIDSKGTKVENNYGSLTYNGLPPYFVVEGDSYGLQVANKNEDNPTANNSVGGMVQLPPTNNTTTKKKDKWQTSLKLTIKAPEKEWTDAERRMIEFISIDIKKIYAHILTRPDRLSILQKASPKIIHAAQETFQTEMTTDGHKYPDQQSQLIRMTQLIKNQIINKTSNKVYRKKKKAPGGDEVNLLTSTVEWDETKHPTLYVDMAYYQEKVNGKPTGKDIFITKFYQYEEGVPEDQWKELSYQEVARKGGQRFEEGVRYDRIWFGADSMAPQLKAAEVVCKKDISMSGLGHTGRLVRAKGEIKKNQKLIHRQQISPVSNNNNNNNVVVGNDGQTATSTFDMSVLSNIPHMSTPSIVSDNAN